jgi:interferon-induced GTP-binding protein Mx1
VNLLLERYLKQDRTITVAVIPSNVDIATVDILERASNVDPDGTRTIGVLTKPDLIGDSGEDEVMLVLQGILKPLNLGYGTSSPASTPIAARTPSLATPGRKSPVD